jgi:hypothetical protein
MDRPGREHRPMPEDGRHVSKIWYCRNCGYEVASRGRCHLCHDRLVASALPELPAGDEDDEVGYRLDGWADRERGRLIEDLNDLEILHRFEEDELVVGADDEARVDDLIAELAANPEGDDALDDDSGSPVPVAGPGHEATTVAVRLLADAAARLHRDPTDMHADADVAEASAVVFMADEYASADEETWAAVGRVTRRLLSALGSEEALEDEIQTQAAVLEKLLLPVFGTSSAESSGIGSDEDETAYELAEWMPEQRAQLSVLLDDASLRYEWDGDDLIVVVDDEAEVEALFDRVGAPSDEDDDDESRYRALEELFAAADRLAGDPGDEHRAEETVVRIEEAAGPVPFGLDDVQWFRIMTQARTLSESIRSGADEQAIGAEAAALRNLLRAVV